MNSSLCNGVLVADLRFSFEDDFVFAAENDALEETLGPGFPEATVVPRFSAGFVNKEDRIIYCRVILQLISITNTLDVPDGTFAGTFAM